MEKKKDAYELLNGLIVIELLDIEPVEETGLVGTEGKKIASVKNISQHPWQAKVILSCSHYTVNGVTYENEIKKGDYILIRDMEREFSPKSAVPKQVVIIDGKAYYYIRHSDVIAIKR